MGEIKIKSGNLFDVNGEHTSMVWDGKECLVIEDGAIIVNQIRPGYMTGIYYDKVYTPGTYTFTMKQLATQSDRTAISVVSPAPFAGGAYNDAYKAYTAGLVKHDDTHYITIVVTEPTEIGFFINGYFSVNDKLVNIQLLEGTYTSETIPEYQPYFLNKPAHQFINGQCIDIPTHHFINGRWQGELTSQSPLRFRADGEMLDWRIDGASGGVGDWDETEQKYKIPVTVNGVTTNLFTDHQLMDGDSIDYTTTETVIPIATGNNTLTVDTAVKPSKVFIKFEG